MITKNLQMVIDAMNHAVDVLRLQRRLGTADRLDSAIEVLRELSGSLSTPTLDTPKQTSPAPVQAPSHPSIRWARSLKEAGIHTHHEPRADEVEQCYRELEMQQANGRCHKLTDAQWAEKFAVDFISNSGDASERLDKRVSALELKSKDHAKFAMDSNSNLIDASECLDKRMTALENWIIDFKQQDKQEKQNLTEHIVQVEENFSKLLQNLIDRFEDVRNIYGQRLDAQAVSIRVLTSKCYEIKTKLSKD